MRFCAIVPSYNHVAAIGGVIARMRAANLQVFVIDDGSEAAAAAALASLHAPESGVVVHRLEPNQGKGQAVTAGFALARAAGFSHAVQVDADGQHDLEALSALLQAARERPEALVTGRPVFDHSMPRGRRIGRWITHVWVWIETLSLQVRDSMCGFRVYPLEAAVAALRGTRHGRRMDFDPEILVRLVWAGTPVIGVPVRVIYPPGNTSNFDLWRDNLRISWMHTRLVALMLPRIPTLLARSVKRTPHWAGMRERGGIWGLQITFAVYRALGRRGCLALLVPVVAYFFATGRQQRQASHEFLTAALGRSPTLAERFRHFLSFAARTLDILIGWAGGMPAGAIQPDNASDLRVMRDDSRGALLIASHHGNAELSRAVLDKATRERLTVLVHTRHAVKFNEMLRSVCPEAVVNLLEVTEIGPETAVGLQDRVARGEWVVIAGDRTPVGGKGRVSRVPFLERLAPFPQGPWILAALLGCPVWLLFCPHTGSGWKLSIERFADRVILPRGEREVALRQYIARYAERLEGHARREPLQWYNFFDFWAH